MKLWNKIVSSVLLAGALTSCSGYFVNPYNPDWYKIDDSKISKEVDTPLEILLWVYQNVDYKTHGHRCFLPQETLNNGYGDCDDQAVLQLAIYFKRCSKKGSLLTGYNPMDNVGHAEPNYCGETFYQPYLFTVEKEYPFDDIQYFEGFYVSD